MNLTREERVLRVIKRQEVDYLPTHITFSDVTRHKEISEKLGLDSEDQLNDYLDNHFYTTLTLHDKPIAYINDEKEIERLKNMGFCCSDRENNVLYDCWGIGTAIGFDSYRPVFHPLQGKEIKGVENFMVPGFNKEVLTQNLGDAVKNFTVPDVNQQDNFSEVKRDLQEKSGDFLVFASGYNGIYERCYLLMGFQEFMLNIATNPKVIEELLDKITDYKVEVAKKLVSLGVKIGHHGDDLGTQESTFFSKDTFRRYILPRLSRIFKVYKDASIPVMMHSCGCITDYLPDLIDIGLDILEPIQPCMDLDYLKKEFGRDLIFWGGIDTQELLPFGTPEEVRIMARKIIRTLGKGGGYIIGPSQAIMKDVPTENIIALLRTIKEEREKVLDI